MQLRATTNFAHLGYDEESNLGFEKSDPSHTGIYYPPRDVFALNTGKYRPGCIFFVYTGAPVLWILSVINFRFCNNISESM